MARKHVNKMPGFVKILFFTFSIYFVITAISLAGEISVYDNDIKQLEDQIVRQQSTNDEMKTQIEEGLTDDYAADLAREKLDYVIEGERVYVDTSSN